MIDGEVHSLIKQKLATIYLFQFETTIIYKLFQFELLYSKDSEGPKNGILAAEGGLSQNLILDPF